MCSQNKLIVNSMLRFNDTYSFPQPSSKHIFRFNTCVHSRSFPSKLTLVNAPLSSIHSNSPSKLSSIFFSAVNLSFPKPYTTLALKIIQHYLLRIYFLNFSVPIANSYYISINIFNHTGIY